MATVSVTVARDKLNAFLTRRVPAMLSGRAPDDFGLAKACLLRVVVAALKDVREDFTAKSQGGTGDDGITWEPLSEYTLKQRSDAGKGSQGTPGPPKPEFDEGAKRLLQQTRKEIFKQEYERLRLGGLSAKEAKRQAGITAKFMAKAAWEARSQSQEPKGAQGQPGAGPGDFPILDDSGRLKAAVSPGALGGGGLNASYSPPTLPTSASGDQELVFENGGVTVFCNVPYGDDHMVDGYGSQTGGFRPARRWAYGPDVPEEWRERWAGVYRDALAELLPEAILAWARAGAKI